MTLDIQAGPLSGILLIKPKIYSDNRGHFYESHNRKKWAEAGLKMDFVQENRSSSIKNTLRGLHFQAPPFAQGKLVEVLHGRALDVVVDIRKDSPTFGEHFAIELCGDEILQMYVPEGFAHGFLALEDTIFNYKCTSYYEPSAENSLLWNDSTLGITWGIDNPILAVKDSKGMIFKDFISPF